MALKIHAHLLEAQKPLTEPEIRQVIGDHPGTGAALRYHTMRSGYSQSYFHTCMRLCRVLVSMGSVEKSGIGSRKFTREDLTGDILKTLPGQKCEIFVCWAFLNTVFLTNHYFAGDPFRYCLKESGFSEPARLELESLVKAEVTSKLFSCEDAAPLSYDFDEPP